MRARCRCQASSHLLWNFTSSSAGGYCSCCKMTMSADSLPCHLACIPMGHMVCAVSCAIVVATCLQRGAPQRYIGVGRSVVPVLERQRGKCCCTLRFRPQYSGGCLRSEATCHVTAVSAITCGCHLVAESVIPPHMYFRLHCLPRVVRDE